MTFDFTSWLIVFQSYQDDGKVLVKSCAQQNSICSQKVFCLGGGGGGGGGGESYIDF